MFLIMINYSPDAFLRKTSSLNALICRFYSNIIDKIKVVTLKTFCAFNKHTKKMVESISFVCKEKKEPN